MHLLHHDTSVQSWGNCLFWYLLSLCTWCLTSYMQNKHKYSVKLFKQQGFYSCLYQKSLQAFCTTTAVTEIIFTKVNITDCLSHILTT